MPFGIPREIYSSLASSKCCAFLYIQFVTAFCRYSPCRECRSELLPACGSTCDSTALPRGTWPGWALGMFLQFLVWEATVTPGPRAGRLPPALTELPCLCKGTVKEKKRANSQQRGWGRGGAGGLRSCMNIPG